MWGLFSPRSRPRPSCGRSLRRSRSTRDGPVARHAGGISFDVSHRRTYRSRDTVTPCDRDLHRHTAGTPDVGGDKADHLRGDSRAESNPSRRSVSALLCVTRHVRGMASRFRQSLSGEQTADRRNQGRGSRTPGRPAPRIVLTNRKPGSGPAIRCPTYGLTPERRRRGNRVRSSVRAGPPSGTRGAGLGGQGDLWWGICNDWPRSYGTAPSSGRTR